MDLFSENIDLVHKIVNRLHYSFIGKDDLLQAGLMGLFYATKKYNPSFNTKFNTFATYYILGEIKKELRTNQLIRLNKELYRIIRYLKKTSAESIEEIAKACNTEKDTVLMAYSYMNKIPSLNVSAGFNERETEILEIIPDERTKKTVIFDALDSLGKEEKELITLRYFRNYSQTEVAQLLKKHQSKVSRMEQGALMKMRKILLDRK